MKSSSQSASELTKNRNPVYNRETTVHHHPVRRKNVGTRSCYSSPSKCNFGKVVKKCFWWHLPSLSL